MRITVFGANGPTGRLLTAQALEAGHRVTAVTRQPEIWPPACWPCSTTTATSAPRSAS